MKTFTFQSELWLPPPKEEVFTFFADARNLQILTPPWLRFEILTPEPIEMRVGALIDYRLRVYGFPVRWRTEITEWNPPHHFVDKQVRGPYTLWVHTHQFSDHNGGTNCLDDVYYRPPGGSLTNRLFVHRDIGKIFSYRRTCLLKHFAQA